MIHGHGGGVEALARKLGCSPSDIDDMSSNISPLGPIPELMDYLRFTVDSAVSLPEPDARAAVLAQADALDLPASWLVAGNGTTELIYSAPRAIGTRRALIIGPTYADYADACRQAGAAFDHCLARANSGFTVNPDRLIKKAVGADTVFWCNPNNPTGVWTPPEVMADVCRACPDTRFIIDESYLLFLNDGDRLSVMRYRLPNAIVLVSYSKIDALAGIRIGFAAAPPALADRFRRVAVPWSVNRLAQAAVVYLAAHRDRVADHRHAVRQHLERVRPLVMTTLADAMPVTWTPSRTSFILGRMASTAGATELVKGLAKHHILIRHCGNFHGLSGRYFRISLKTDAVHERLMAAVTDIRSGLLSSNAPG